MPDMTPRKRPPLKEGILRIDMPGGEYRDMPVQSDPMFGGRPTQYQDFPGGGFMEMQKVPEQAPPQSDMMPEGIPSQLRDRSEYEKFLRSKYGDPLGDLRKLNQSIEQQTKQDKEALFRHVFGNQFRYEDRKYLDSKAQSYWQKSLLKYRKNVENKIKSDIEIRKEQHEGSLKAFDDYMKTFKTTKPKEPTISDYDKAERVLYDISHDEDGKPIQATKASMAIAKKIFDKLGLSLEEVQTRAAEKGWFGGTPAMTGLQLAPETLDLIPQTQQTPESIKQRYKTGEISREEAIRLLQQAGM